ncbi:T9SS type A sorting domain-containing protein, partial [bacterium]|nr:T9SS type A sorting domain-containing protein [bacterium]
MILIKRLPMFALFFALLFAQNLRAFAPEQNSIEPIIPKMLNEEFFDETYLSAFSMQGAEWEFFLSENPGNWRIIVNRLTGQPHRVWGGRIFLSDPDNLTENNIPHHALRFLQSNQHLMGLNIDELELQSCQKQGKLWYVHFEQQKDGVGVYRSRTDIRIHEDGYIVLFGSDFQSNIGIQLVPDIPGQSAINIAISDLGTDSNPIREIEPELFILPVINEDLQYDYHLVWNFKIYVDEPLGNWEYMIDAITGEILYRLNDLRFDILYGNITGMAKRAYYDDPVVEEEMRHIDVIFGSYSTNADGFGYYEFSGLNSSSRNFQLYLEGNYLNVDYEDGDDAYYSTTISPADSPYDFMWSTSEALIDEMNVYYHANLYHDYVKHVLHYDGMDYQMPAIVRVGSNYDNAYWDGYGINFGEGGSYFWNLALHCDVIYHEYTHGVTHFIYPEGSLPYYGQSGAMDEGFSDYFACTVTNESDMGERIYRSNPAEVMRSLDNAHRYPENFIGEVHYDGMIFGGALWDLREEIGAGPADSIIHMARFGFPETFEDYLVELLLVDDDDSDLENGSPHMREIYENFHLHGIGSGYTLEIIHTPLPDSEDSVSSYALTARVVHVVSLVSESTFVCYSTDGGGTWNTLSLTESGPDHYEGAIPAQPYGSEVRYYLKSQDIHSVVAYSPTYAPAGQHVFRVGYDSEAPLIRHSPLPDQSRISWPAMVRCEVTDNLGLSEVICMVNINSLSAGDIVLNRFEDTDEYNGYIDFYVEVGDLVEYRLKAVDASLAGNVTYYLPATYLEFEILDRYFEPMEYEWVPYFSYSHEDGHPDTARTYGNQWHLSGLRNHTSGGSQCWKCGSYDFNDYEDLLDAALVSPQLRLGVDSRLFFWQYMDAETSAAHSGRCYDGGLVEISLDDGGSWNQIFPEGGYPFTIRDGSIRGPFYEDTPVFSGHRNWEELEFDLSAYTGIIRLRWRFGSDGAYAGEGWYLDDITLESDSVYVLSPEGEWKPRLIELYDNYPNPFNAQTRIFVRYDFPHPFSISIIDLMGREVKSFFIQPESGQYYYSVNWNGLDEQGRNLPSGVYLYRLESETKNITKRC